MIKEIALQEIGVEEKPINKVKYGEWYGANGQPWCAMFVSWVYAQAGLSKKIAAQSSKGFASCDVGLKWFAKKDKLVPVGQAQEGDIVFFQFDTDAQPDHVGIVIKNNAKRQSLICVEGNTSPNKTGSQSNGGQVSEKKRAYATVMAVARP
jgi:cell wall-associated NlpC family hydrolase